MTCVTACPVEAYPDANSACQPCADSCIRFTEAQYIVSLPEDTEVSTVIVIVGVTDRRQQDRRIQFAITSGDPRRQFVVNASSGDITLAGSLDRENQGSHTLTVMAFDAGTNPVSSQSASATVLVLVGDVNDNRPVFTQEQFSTTVAENSPAGILLLTIATTDADTPPNAGVTYTLAPGTHSGLFQLDSTTGELTTTTPLDFEQQQAYLLVVVATDSGSPPLSSSAQVTVGVIDQNDVRPTFRQTRYSVSLSELTSAGSTVLQLEANDTDSIIISYELTEGDLNGAFRLDSASGLLSTATSLDYESVSNYTLTIVARDGVPNPLASGTATILIAITDENDNAPAFSQSEFTATIVEDDLPMTFITTITAEDLDSGNNSVVDYSIAMGNTTMFLIDSTGSLFSLVSLDREEQPTYILVVTATDRGLPPLSNNATVTVLVSDVNDNAPQFVEALVAVSLTEGHPVGTVVASFQAIDADIGSNAAVTFELANSTDLPFSMNRMTGEVSLAQFLDYEVVTSYEIPIVARDGASLPLSSTALLVVNVSDLNDNSPVFSQELYFVSIPENQTVGLSVLQVVADDQDSGTNAAVTYRIIAGNQESTFAIDNNTGVITLESGVDFERQVQYVLTLSAANSQAEPPLASTAMVRINISELNEHAPTFSRDTYLATLMENSPTGTLVTTVEAADLDVGSSGEISFEIITGNIGSVFDITSAGNLLTLRPLDREQQETYTLTVAARDSGTPSLSSTAAVMVTVLDLNDSPPQFTFTVPYTATLAENAPQGTAIMTTPPLEASDADSAGANSDITFSIAGGDPSGFFTIDSRTAQLRLERSVDFEMVNQFELTITATDNGDPRLSSNATVVVSISDQNDNPPVISGMPPQALFTEGQGQLVLAPNVSVMDADSLPLLLITISLSGPGVQTGQVGRLSVSAIPLSVEVNSENNGQRLELSGSFTPNQATSILQTLTFGNSDDEPDPASRFVMVSLSDGTFTSTARVEVLMELVNDNRPQVDLDTTSPGVGFTTVFTEEGMAVAVTGNMVDVTDVDSGTAGIVSLRAELTNARDGASEGLRVVSSGVLEVQYGLNNHTITVTAPEPTAFAAFESLLAILTYFNSADEPQPPLHRTVQVTVSDGMLESEPVTSAVTILLVNDPPRLSLGRNVDYQVEFVEGRGPILLTSSSDFVLMDSDDAELQNATISLLNSPDGTGETLIVGATSSNLTIMATNHSILIRGPALVSEFASVLQSTSYNNILASPSASQRQVEFTVSDGNMVTIATTLVTFNLVNDPPLLDLNGPQQGNDFATDFFEGSLPVPATSELALQDVDSLFLHFATVQLSPILDGVLEGLLYSRSETDTPLNITISPNLIEFRGAAPLSTYAAVLQDISYFNRAEEPTAGQRMVEFVVSDGEANSSAVTTITVLQVNDIPELLLNGGEVYAVNYEEETSAVGIVNQQSISLRDNDTATLAFLRVAISGVYDGVAEILGFQDPSSDQSLDDTQVNNPGVREQVHTFRFSPESSTFENFQLLMSSLSYRHAGLEPRAGVRTFEIAVSDGTDLSSPPQQSTVNVTLLNDNAPSFQQFIVQASALENTVDIAVATVMATDDDSNLGPFASQGTVQYAIIGGNEAESFAIGPESGTITLVRPKDREESTAGAVLTVQATNPVPLDNPLATYPTSFVIISILDQNDNVPRFIGEPYRFQVAENATGGYSVGTVQATDADTGSNAEVTFEISQGDPELVFQIGRDTGVLAVANSAGLDRESTASYTLSITVTDQGRPALSNTTTASIEVLDINDSPPVFSDPSFAASISEFTALGTLVLNVTASDADVGANGRVSYQLEGTSVFTIDGTTGVISTSASLDREAEQVHTFTTVARDSGSPQLSTSVQISVTILDENDNFPLFEEADYSAAVSESLPVGQPVLTVASSDQDSGSNGQIMYSINGSVPFIIHPTSGTITVGGPLDREIANAYQFEVVAVDGGSPPLQTSVPISVTILDSNDNQPLFSQQQYETQLAENVALLQSVFTVSATDTDEGSNGRITYSLAPGGVGGQFQVNSSSGEVITVGSIDREEQGSYQLEVIAMDQGSPPLSSRATLTINIIDLNDNVPVFSAAEYQFTVPENSPPAAIDAILATDSDLGTNAQITYSLVSFSLQFSINETTGALSTLRPLDREQVASYNLTVLATDGGQPPNSAAAAILVTVEDRNDIVPEFTAPSYTTEVPENLTSGSILLTVTAEDGDIGSNAAVSYQLLSGSADGVFNLNPLSGELQLSGSLDAETRTFYVLTVQVRDGGSPSLSSNTTVTVMVSDVNDNPIQLAVSSTTATYVEEDPPVSIAPNITIQDDDITPLVQSATVDLLTVHQCCQDQLSLGTTDPGVSIQLLDNNRLLMIEGPATISTMSTILQSVWYQNTNVEPQLGSIPARFTVSDGVFTASATITIMVQTINDHAPIVLLGGDNMLNTSVSFVENSAAVPIAHQAAITDGDSDALSLASITVMLQTPLDGTQEFLTAEASGLVSVLPSSGGPTIQLSGPAPIENFTAVLSSVRYHNSADNPRTPLRRTIKVVASDGELASLPSYVVVTIVPVNDSPTLRLSASVDFNTTFTEGGAPVALTSAGFQLDDPDSESLSASSITLVGTLDHGNEVLLFEDTTSPVFSRISATQLQLTGPALLAAFATALQSVSYLNNATEPTPGTRSVQFTVSDGSLTATAFADVSVRTTNDPPRVDLNGPQAGVDYVTLFVEAGEAIAVAPSAAVIEDPDDVLLSSMLVRILPPTDGTRELLTASYDGSNITDTFDSASGTLLLSGSASIANYRTVLLSVRYQNVADEPSGQQRLLEVVVNDAELSSEPVIVAISFIFVNDPPVVVLDSGGDFSTIFIENSPPVAIVNPRSVNVMDVDTRTLAYLSIQLSNLLDGDLERLDYSNTSDGLTVETQSDTSSQTASYNFTYASEMPPTEYASLLSSLEYQNLASEPNASLPRLITVSVSDGALRSRPVTSSVEILLIDDNQPQFEPGAYTFSIAEDGDVGSTVGVVSASDVDIGDTFLYQLSPGGTPFSINSTSGVITIREALDRESQSSYALTSQLSRDTPPFSLFDSEATIVVAILDVNDNTPTFNQTTFSLEVVENTAVGTTVEMFAARDEDEGSNAALEFSLSGTNFFEVGNHSGALVVRNHLDRESVATIQFLVMVMDGGEPPLSSQVGVVVTLLDVNDQVPQFLQGSYFTQLVETTPPGATILQLSAADDDAGTNAELTFTLSPTTAEFTINSTTGTITTSSTITPNVYNFTAMVTDGGQPPLSSSAAVTIQVISVNSTLPVFTLSSYEGTIVENLPSNTSILTAVAFDPITSEPVRYSLTVELPELLLDPLTGVLSSNASLDRESRDVYQLQLTATSADGTRVGFSQAIVQVLDANDFTPVFSQTSYSFTAVENGQAGAVVGAVLATDSSDIGLNAAIVSYSISHSSFSISSVGIITAGSSLDREAQEQYTIAVFATDGGSPPLTGSSMVVVTVLDQNDNAPKFSQPSYEAAIEERQPAGSSVVTVGATDRDEGSNAEVIYTTNSTTFAIHPQTGVISTSEELDFEQVNSHEVVVFATDRGQTPLASTAVVTVQVIDIDDTRPEFTTPVFTGSVHEEQGPTTIVSVTAVDTDSGPENPIVFSITAGNDDLQFNVSLAGVVMTLVPLDRETTSRHTLTIEASNMDAFGSTLASMATVLIDVLDINDHPPEFLGTPYAFSVAENAPGGTFVGSMVAADADEGSNANISDFRIIVGSSESLFELNAQSGTLQLSNSALLDRETQDTYTLTVEVADGGTPPLSSNTTVRIVVTDVNDEAPVFSREAYSVSLREDTVVGSIIFTANASDVDLGTNADFAFSLAAPSSLFSVNSTTGAISLQSSLDFETVRLHSITLLAIDAGTPQLTGSATLSVTVEDVDDLPVVFEPDTYSASVFENSPPGTTIATVVAQDPDTVGNPITYTISPPPVVPFAVDPLSGAVTVAGELDRESVSRYMFNVFASNSPGTSATATVTVQIADVNDVIPSFPDAPFQFQVLESVPPGTILGQVTAEDSDLGLAGTIVGYQLQNAPREFDIDPTTGALNLTDALDFEMVDQYVVNVTAVDGGDPSLVGSTVVVVIVLDSNDNAPQFSSENFNVNVSENAGVGSDIFIALATDSDSGPNSQIIYSISPSSAPFAIDPRSGAVNLTAPLALRTYFLQLMATDGGTPPLTSTAVLTVVVTDANEPPSFSEASYSLQLSENTNTSVVLRVLALDPDTGSNAEISYSIRPEGVFAIASDSGTITLTQSLDFEQVTSYSRTLVATDSGNPPLSSLASLSVTVLDENDNAPEFSQSSYTVSVPEDTPLNSVLLFLNATDADSSSNAAVTYVILADSSAGSFSVDPLTGAIFTLQRLDFEIVTQAEVSVLARDGGQPVMSSSASVTILITDVDDHPPVFGRQLYTATTAEDAIVGNFLLTIQANDSDSGANAVVEYRLTNASTVPLSINTTTGELTVAPPGLDREMVEVYLLVVEAYNPLSSLFTATATVQVTVLDSNDNSPQFDPTSLTFTISESASVGAPIGTLNATDADAGSNAVVSYFIEPTSVFVVDSISGELTVNASLDFESTPVVELTAVARDGGNPPLSSTATVRVVLEDANDEPPVVNISSSQFTFREGSAPTTIGSGISVSDPDTFPLVSASVRLFSSLRMIEPPAADFIQLDRAFSESRGLSLSASPHCINVTGNGSMETYMMVLSRLQFGSTAPEPVDGVRQVQLQVFDGRFTSNVASISITVQLINDNPPVLDLSVSVEGLGFQTVFTEGGAFVFLVAQDASLSDADGDDIQSVAITITNPLDAPLERLSAFALGRVSVQQNTSGITLLGPASVAEFEIVLKTVSYDNVADEPRDVQTARIVEFAASDGSLTSQPVSTTVIIQPVNDPPVLRLGSTQDIILVYSEAARSLPLVSDNFMLSDVDSDLLSFVNVTVVDFLPGIDRFNISTEGTNITAEFLSGTLLLTGLASIPEFVTVLQTLDYINTFVETDQLDQLVGGRVIAFTANDGSLSSQTVGAFITFSAVNDPPLLDLNGPEPGTNFATTFEEGSAAVLVVSPQLTIADVDSQFLQSATAQLSGNVDQSSETLFTTEAAAGITSTFDPNTAVLTVSGSATAESYQSVLRSLAYRDTALEPTPGTRTVTITVNDGEASSIPRTSTITVANLNDPPALSLTPASLPFMEGGAPVPLISTSNITDTDNQTLALLEVTIHNAVDGLSEVINSSVSFNSPSQPTTGTLVYTFSLTPQGTIAQYVSLLSSLTYSNMAPEPASSTRTISITVSDGVSFSPAVTLLLQIVLVNDNPPTFSSTNLQLDLLESTNAGTSVFQTEAADEDVDSVLIYSLANTTSVFNMNESNGEITLVESLDRESQEHFTLIILATDGLSTAQLQLDITVLDANDNSPVFSPSLYNASAVENSPVGTAVVQVVAFDADEGTNAEVSYSIMEGDAGGTFHVNETSGLIQVAGVIDFETTDSYSLLVVARDSGVPSMMGASFVVVTVVNLNDNPPVFTPSITTVSWPEDTPQGTVLYTAQATDLDADSRITYSLLNDSAMFAIAQTTGSVSLTRPLDREQADSHTLIISASDGEFDDTFQLTIMVTDIDDNPPVFLQDSFLISVPENTSIGDTLQLLAVFDPDIGTNAAVQFLIVSGDSARQFEVTQFGVAGELILAGALDREVRSSYDLIVVARNPNNPLQNDSAVIRIEVSDVNDSPPRFEETLYEFSIPENATAGTVVGGVAAMDADSGSNADLTYAITSGDPEGSFGVSSRGDVVLSQLLDRENNSRYVLTILAQDGGSPTLSASAIIVINISDINDNRPELLEALISTSLLENSPPGTTLATVSAQDSDEGLNSDVVYSVHPDNASLFAVGSQSGVVTTRVMFDFESSPSTLLVVVLATDGGSPSLSAETMVILTLLDVNEFTPQFEASQFVVELREDVPVFTTIINTTATDMDGGVAGILQYTLVGQLDAQPFEINSTTGDIFTTGELDREMRSSYQLTVQASNPLVVPPLPSTVVITITLLDVNDNPPRFAQEFFSAAVTSRAEVGAPILTAGASDPDLGTNSEIRYFLLETSGRNFAISGTNGTIVLASSLSSTGTFILTVTATDQGAPPLSSIAMVTITVIQPVQVQFAQDGAGFILGGGTGTTQQFGLFADMPGGSDGRISATLGGEQVEAHYSSALPPAVGVRGVVLEEEAWHDQPDIRVVVQVSLL